MIRLPSPVCMKPLPPFAPRFSVPPAAKVVFPAANASRVSVLADVEMIPVKILLPMLVKELPRMFDPPRPEMSIPRATVMPVVPPWIKSDPPGRLLLEAMPPMATGLLPVPSCAGSVTTSVPLLMLSWPEKLFAFVSVSVPLPVSVRLPLPEIVPPKLVRLLMFARFVSQLMPPTVSVPPPLSTTLPPLAPPPESEPMTTLKPFTSSAAPATFARLTAEFGPSGPPVIVGMIATLSLTEAGAKTTDEPALTVPPLIVVGPV